MGTGADARAGRKTQDRGRGQVEERPGANRRPLERLLTTGATERLGFAPAKVNLFLHVGPLAADGFHPLCSLMAFADVGDQLTPDPAAGDGLLIDGPFAQGLSAGADNLVLRARDLTLSAVGGGPFGLRLIKNLPLASGIGGGSADAAAAIRLTACRAGADPMDPALLELAATLGSDVPACLGSKAVLVRGRGETLQPPPALPPLPAVLVNPGVASPTAGAYRAYDAAPSGAVADLPSPGAALSSPRDAALFLGRCRNDLQGPVTQQIPAIGEALTLLAGQAETLLARMSGSGATCFALVADQSAGERLAARIARLKPHWWVRPVVLGGAP